MLWCCRSKNSKNNWQPLEYISSETGILITNKNKHDEEFEEKTLPPLQNKEEAIFRISNNNKYSFKGQDFPCQGIETESLGKFSQFSNQGL